MSISILFHLVTLANTASPIVLHSALSIAILGDGSYVQLESLVVHVKVALYN